MNLGGVLPQRTSLVQPELCHSQVYYEANVIRRDIVCSAYLPKSPPAMTHITVQKMLMTIILYVLHCIEFSR